jgi:hypothetical protein
MPTKPTTRQDIMEMLEWLDPRAVEIHTTACAKGWWDISGPEGKIPVRDTLAPKLHTRNFGEIIMLAVSELAEALECYRTGKPVTEVWIENGKPEGFPIEIADTIIRLLDNLVASGGPGNRLSETTSDTVMLALNVIQSANIPEQLLRITTSLCHTYSSHYEFLRSAQNYRIYLIQVVIDILIFCHHHDIDIRSAVTQKMQYNDSRPYRHGGKIA